MISVTTRAYVEKSRIVNLKLPENIKLNSGEYEIVVVINTSKEYLSKKKSLSFSEHIYQFESENITLFYLKIIRHWNIYKTYYLLVQQVGSKFVMPI